MTPKENLKLDKINKRITWFMSILSIVLIAYLPLINSNSKASQKAIDGYEAIEKLMNLKFLIIEEKLDEMNKSHDEDITELENKDVSILDYIEKNKLNFQDLGTDLLQKGVIEELKLRTGSN